MCLACAMVGPKAAVIRAFAADKPIGPEFDLYCSAAGTRSVHTAIGRSAFRRERSASPRGVGKNQLSQGGMWSWITFGGSRRF